MSLWQVLMVLQKTMFLASLDLQDAYWHVPINIWFRNYLAFVFADSLYRFKVLPFDLDRAPRVFTKMMGVHVQTLQWLAMSWNTDPESEMNRLKIKRLSSFSYVAEVLPLGRLWQHWLVVEGNLIFSQKARDKVVHFILILWRRLRWWIGRGWLRVKAQWHLPTPLLKITIDALDSGWRYQSSRGHQGSGMRSNHIFLAPLLSHVSPSYMECQGAWPTGALGG